MTLAVTEFKLRFFGSVLGYLWQLVRPLMLFGVLYFVFTKFVKLGGGVPHYPVLLLADIVLYTFFADGTGAVSRWSTARASCARSVPAHGRCRCPWCSPRASTSR